MPSIIEAPIIPLRTSTPFQASETSAIERVWRLREIAENIDLVISLIEKDEDLSSEPPSNDLQQQPSPRPITQIAGEGRALWCDAVEEQLREASRRRVLWCGELENQMLQMARSRRRYITV